MSTYAIGDIQGCLDELLSLLELIGFSREYDQLWFAGDIVNRGPKSLQTLRFIKSLGESAITVLGNHDLHLLAASETNKSHRKDTFDEIFAAPDRVEILDWLRHRPLLHYDAKLKFAMVHAGVAPHWSLSQAQAYAVEVETVLSGENYHEYLAQIYGNQPEIWSDDLVSWNRLRCITNYFTRVRFCNPSGEMNFNEKGAPGNQPSDLLPWYELENRHTAQINIVFGHWSTHKLNTNHFLLGQHNVYPIDTGCLWGGELTALRLEDKKTFHVLSQSST